ncbi:hypothetical protein V8C37DRAFT_383968 [Trichoderma ceciliae]
MVACSLSLLFLASLPPHLEPHTHEPQLLSPLCTKVSKAGLLIRWKFLSFNSKFAIVRSIKNNHICPPKLDRYFPISPSNSLQPPKTN